MIRIGRFTIANSRDWCIQPPSNQNFRYLRFWNQPSRNETFRIECYTCRLFFSIGYWRFFSMTDLTWSHSDDA